MMIIASLLGLAFFAPAESPARFHESFDAELCVAPCRGARWALAQQVEGQLETVSVGGRRALRAVTGPRRERVPKAALVARPPKVGPGGSIQVGFDVMIPEGAPINSIHLVDIECATCGVGGNPGIRLYLRNGRLRIDRAKIGVRHAWTADEAPQLQPGRWHRIEWSVALGAESGAARVRLDGRTVLEGQGATMVEPAAGNAPGADRVQIGLTASSNSVPATAYFDNVTVEAGR